MEQISPVTVLPQASYIDFVPTVEKELDYKTLFSLEQQRATAEYRRKQDQINNRIKMQSTFNTILTDPNSPLNMVGDNDPQRAILSGIREKINPLLNEIDQMYATRPDDVNSIMNAERKLTQELYTNPDFRKIIEAKTRYAGQEKLFSKLDPDAVTEHQGKYLNWDGTGDDPLMGFNPSNMMPWDEDKYTKALKNTSTEVKTMLGGEYTGYEGVILKSEESYEKDLDRLWTIHGRGLTKQGYTKEDFITSQKENYYRGAGKEQNEDGTITWFRVLDSPSNAALRAAGQTNSDGTPKTGKEPVAPVQIGSDGITYIPNATSNNYDGLWAGTQKEINPLMVSPINQISVNNDQKKEGLLRMKEIANQQATIKKQFGADKTKWSKEVNDSYNNLAREVQEVGYNIKSIDAQNTELKNDAFYKSPEYKDTMQSTLDLKDAAKMVGGDLLKTTLGALGIVPEFVSKYSNLTDAIVEDAGNVNSKIGHRDFLLLNFENKRIKLQALKKELSSKGKSTKNVDEYLTFIDDIETNTYEKYINNNSNLQTARGSISAYSVNNDDPDVAAVINTYNNKSGQEAINAASQVGGIRLANGTKYKGSADEGVVTGDVVYDPNTGTYALSANIGTLVLNDKKERTYDPKTGKLIIEDSKPALISDRNVNREMLNTFLYDPNNPEAPRVAEYLFPKLAKTVDLKEGRTTVISRGNDKYSITNIGGGQYSVSVNGEQATIVNNRFALARNIAKYESTKAQTNNTTTNTTNTSGGGNVGKSQSSSIKEGIRQAESGGEKDPARARNKETNALGYFGLVPSSQFDKLTPFVTKNWREFGVDLSKYTPEAIAAFKKELGRKEGAKGYSDEDIKAYMAIQDHPEMQDAYFDKVLMPKQYLPNVNKIIAAYAKNGKNINEAQAIDIMHHHGIGNAQDGNWQKYPARAWAASYQGENKKETQDVNNRIKNYNFAFQSGQSTKGVNSSLIDSTKHLIIKSGLDMLGPEFSSGHRKGSGKSDHNHGNAIDFKFRNSAQEADAINKIANLTGDPALTKKMLLKGKGTNGVGIEPVLIKIKDTGKTLRIIYHADSDGVGQHLHISSN